MRVARILIAWTLLAPAVLHAQDIETRAAMLKRALPAAYYERIARDPTTFQLEAGWRSRLLAAQRAQAAVGGTLPIAVIPAGFSDGTQPPAVVSTAALQQALFDGSGSITAYFTELSGGRITMRGQVANWVRTSLTMQQVVGNSRGLGGDARVGEWLRQAVAAADEQFDFRAFDNDGSDGIPNSGDDDGRVDAAAFVFHEIDASCGGPSIWPHRSRVSGWTGGAAVTQDLRPNGQPIVVDDYIVLGGMDCTGTKPLGSQVFAHEMGHVLGLPDYYDASAGLLREQRRWVIGCWDLMSGGSWGCGRGQKPDIARPPHMGPYPKALLGWLTPTLVPSGMRNVELTLRPARDGAALRVALGPDEYLLLEYRDGGGFDAELPARGVLVYHVQTNRPWAPATNTAARRYGYALIEADENNALVTQEEQGGNRGEATDVFGPAVTALSNVTHALMRLNSSVPSTVTIHSISIDPVAKLAKVRLTTATTPVISATTVSPLRALDATARIELPINGGAQPYSASYTGTAPGGLILTVDGDKAVLAGTPQISGTFSINVTVRDALGTTTPQSLTLVVEPPVIAVQRLVAGLEGGSKRLSAEEEGYLDRMGNGNGKFDVGDVRAYLGLTQQSRQLDRRSPGPP